MKTADEKLEQLVGNVLRAGVLLSAVVVLAGGILYLARHGGNVADYRVFQGEPKAYRTVGAMLSGALAGSGREIILVGILLLIATPVLRVALCVIGFLFEKDWLYVLFTTVVLAVLLASLLGGLLSAAS